MNFHSSIWFEKEEIRNVDGVGRYIKIEMSLVNATKCVWTMRVSEGLQSWKKAMAFVDKKVSDNIYIRKRLNDRHQRSGRVFLACCPILWICKEDSRDPEEMLCKEDNDESTRSNPEAFRYNNVEKKDIGYHSENSGVSVLATGNRKLDHRRAREGPNFHDSPQEVHGIYYHTWNCRYCISDDGSEKRSWKKWRAYWVPQDCGRRRNKIEGIIWQFNPIAMVGEDNRSVDLALGDQAVIYHCSVYEIAHGLLDGVYGRARYSVVSWYVSNIASHDGAWNEQVSHVMNKNRHIRGGTFPNNSTNMFQCSRQKPFLKVLRLEREKRLVITSLANVYDTVQREVVATVWYSVWRYSQYDWIISPCRPT